MSLTNKPRLFIEKEDRELYNKIEKLESFFKTDNKSQYLYALSLGFINNFHKALASKDGWIYEDYLDEKEKSLLKAVALFKTKNLQVLTDKNEILKISDEYAHGGIHILADKIASKQFGTFYKQEEVDIKSLYDKIKLKK